MNSTSITVSVLLHELYKCISKVVISFSVSLLHNTGFYMPPVHDTNKVRSIHSCGKKGWWIDADIGQRVGFFSSIHSIPTTIISWHKLPEKDVKRKVG